MPELPEVETMRRGIGPIVGSRIADVQRTTCRLRPIEVAPSIQSLRRRTKNAEITAVGRAGKRVVIELSTADRIVIEPRMTGLVLLASPPNWEHLRLRFELTCGAVDELLYWDRRGLGSVRLFSADEFADRLGLARLGPDALETTPEVLKERLGKSRRAIKVALLDQRAVAGIGNLYASEILHLASIHPATPCQRLKPEQWQRIHAATIEVLEEAILHEGSTLSDGTYRNALNQTGSYQNMHRVYDRAGQPCGRCDGGSIVRLVQAQRSTFFCPACQRLRARNSRPRAGLNRQVY
jgi:formamidopyrimidine-DNA glycosylase